MITAIQLTGFQSHVASSVPLAPGLSVIVGPTDSGKTAIIRAIRWLAFNEPTGEAFLNKEVGETRVEVQLDSGVIVVKNRSKGKTTYLLRAPGAEDSVFDKSEVPEEIRKALGLQRQSFGDFEAALNFSYQLDPPFLISEPASAGAKVLGKLAGTEIVDMAIKSVSKDTHRHNADRLQAAKDVEKFEARIAEYADLDGQKEQLAACEYLIGIIVQQNSVLAGHRAKQATYESTTSQVTRLAADLERLADLPRIEADVKQAEEFLQRLTGLQGFGSQLARIDATIRTLADEQTRYVNLVAAQHEVTDLEKSHSRYADLCRLSAGYDSQTVEITRLLAILDKTTHLDEAAAQLSWSETAEAALRTHQKLRSDFTAADTQVTRYKTLAEQLQPIMEAAAQLPVVETKYARLQTLLGLRATFTVKESTLTRALEASKQAIDEEARLNTELSEIWAGLDVCPLCEQSISKGR